MTPAAPHRVNVSTPPDSALEVGGLTDQQVAERQIAGLVNTQNNATSRSTATIIRTHLFTMFNLVLGLCGLAVILVGSWLDTLFLLAAIANVVIGFTQEFSAKRQLDRIALLAPRRAARGEDSGKPLYDALRDLLTGVAIGELRQLRNALPPMDAEPLTASATCRL